MLRSHLHHKASTVLTEATSVIDCCPLKVSVFGIAFGFVACILQISICQIRAMIIHSSREIPAKFAVNQCVGPHSQQVLTTAAGQESQERQCRKNLLTQLWVTQVHCTLREGAAKAINGAIGARQ